MNIDDHIKATEHLLSCQKAFKEGKKILFLEEPMKGFPTWKSDSYCYSIAPEPKLRPWKREEIPFACILRRKDMLGVYLFLQDCDNAEDLLEKYQWCWPHEQFDEKAWKPCGVVE